MDGTSNTNTQVGRSEGGQMKRTAEKYVSNDYKNGVQTNVIEKNVNTTALW